MAQTLRHPLRGGLTALASIAALVGMLALIDGRVRSQLSTIFQSGAPTDEVRAVGEQMQGLAYTVIQAVQDQSLEHAPMVIFALAAVVLVLFMTKT